jgi:hypothetical protein
MSGTLFDVRNQVASLKQVAYREAPVPAALAGWSFVGLERLGEKATGTRKRRMSLLSAGLMMMLVGPAAAQVSCDNGALGFLTNLHSLVQQSAGLIIVSMVIAAGVMKMIPTRGTNAIGNALIGGVLVGVVFLVVGPALVDIAAQTSPVDMTAQCGGGSGGG